jgi:hypothetical protein
MSHFGSLYAHRFRLAGVKILGGDSVGAVYREIWKFGAKTSRTDGSSNCNSVNVLLLMFFCLDKKCKSHLWKKTLMSLQCLVQRVHISSKPDWWFGYDFDVWINCMRNLESVISHHVLKHSFLTELYFLSNWPSHFLCGHHWTFLSK